MIKPYCESKRYLLQFDKDWNLILDHIDSIDFIKEHDTSSKRLKRYMDSNNLEGMKYELSKLWMMIRLINKTLNSKKFNELPSFAIETSQEHKAKEKVASDFKLYYDKLMEIDPSFNFTEYYNNSPFSSATEKNDTPTLEFMRKMIIEHMNPIV